ncbi:MAG: hypothetical protein GY702_18405 [Desulfobulbaceae bacterium]|nr:hypothetical protein [Desulfobulbaceae bacterium]
MKKQYEKWIKKVDSPSAIKPAFSLLAEAFSLSDTPTLHWHRATCRVNFMSSAKLERYADITPASDNPELDLDNSLQTSTRVLRSHMDQYSKDKHCVLCCSGEGSLSRVLTFNKHEQLQQLANVDPKLMIRLQDAYDAIAGDILYHPLCLMPCDTDCDPHPSNTNASPDVYSELKREILSLTKRGHAVLASSCWERFQDLCAAHQVPVPYYFTAKRKFFLNKLCSIVPDISVIPKKDIDEEDSLIISSCLSPVEVQQVLEVDEDIRLKPHNQSEMEHMVHVALYLNRLILDHEQNETAELTEETAFAAVPEGLYIFMALVYGGSGVLETGNDDDGIDETQYQKATKL